MMRAKLAGFLERPDTVARRYPSSDTSLPARYARAISAYRTSNLSSALTQIDALIQTQPNNPYFHELKGQALLESAVYDSSGQPITASFMDYTMPRADDLPSFKLSHTPTLCPGNPLGVKGCGEAGAIGASAAVINAITNAIGNNKLEMPATPDRVWHAIHG